MADQEGIFKAYDVRGTVPDQLDETVARRVGAAFVALLDRADLDDADPTAAGTRRPVLVGHDMRTTSAALAAALVDGVLGAGRNVLFAGLASTDEIYFGSGSLDVPAVVVTASHNPASYNGFKLCRSGAAALSRDTGLAEIGAAVLGCGAAAPASGRRGKLTETALLPSYVDTLHRLVPAGGRRLKVVVDAANAMAGHTVPAVFARLHVELVPLYFELDGTFPHHEANPLVAENLRDLAETVVRTGADFGLAFDGDADRCFAVDERGEPVSPSAVTCLIAVRELARQPGATVLHNVITSRAVAETVRAHGGLPLRTPVGHSLIKAEMARTGAVFAGEHSGHYYFRDFWCADSGMLAALHLIAALAATDEPLSVLAAAFEPYVASGELSERAADPQQVLADVATRYESEDDVRLDRLDGLSVIAPDWWFNVRPSNTEPLLRLNVEARDDATMASVRDSVLRLMRRTT